MAFELFVFLLLMQVQEFNFPQFRFNFFMELLVIAIKRDEMSACDWAAIWVRILYLSYIG